MYASVCILAQPTHLCSPVTSESSPHSKGKRGRCSRRQLCLGVCARALAQLVSRGKVEQPPHQRGVGVTRYRGSYVTRLAATDSLGDEHMQPGSQLWKDEGLLVALRHTGITNAHHKHVDCTLSRVYLFVCLVAQRPP